MTNRTANIQNNEYVEKYTFENYIYTKTNNNNCYFNDGVQDNGVAKRGLPLQRKTFL